MRWQVLYTGTLTDIKLGGLKSGISHSDLKKERAKVKLFEAAKEGGYKTNKSNYNLSYESSHT